MRRTFQKSIALLAPRHRWPARAYQSAGVRHGAPREAGTK
jgi:hypothetical protein